LKRGDLTRKYYDNIKMDITKVECEGMDWIHPARAGSCEYDNKLSGIVKGRKVLD